ncbi:MAG: M16 family metallopeptidase [Candidatus Cyclobacteriaceae bacterium M3_2C_046]
MRYLYLFLIISVLNLCTACQNETQEQAEESDIFPYHIHQKTLDNQLNVVTVPYPSPGLVAFHIIVRAGSREEVEPGKTGFAHFFEHMMFRGTENYSPDQYNKILKTIGAGANANTSLDRTIYHMTGNAEMLDRMFEIEADRFMHLHYSEHDFKTEAGAVKGEYTKNYASPYSQLYEKILNTAFDQHTYKHTTMGFWEDIVDMPNQYAYSLEFFDRFYRPEYTTILVVGDVTPDRVNELAERFFGKWEEGDYHPEIPAEPTQQETRYAHVSAQNFPPYLSLNYKAPGFNNEVIDNAALDVIASMLFSERSELYTRLVIEEGLLRSLNAGQFFTRDPYLFTINASFKQADDLQQVKDAITQQLNQIKNEPVDPQLLRETVSHIKYSFAMEQDSPSSIANSLAYFIWVTGNPESLNQYYSLYDRITQDDIMQVARKYFVPEKLTIATISPNEEGGIQ